MERGNPGGFPPFFVKGGGLGAPKAGGGRGVGLVGPPVSPKTSPFPRTIRKNGEGGGKEGGGGQKKGKKRLFGFSFLKKFFFFLSNFILLKNFPKKFFPFFGFWGKFKKPPNLIGKFAHFNFLEGFLDF